MVFYKTSTQHLYKSEIVSRYTIFLEPRKLSCKKRLSFLILRYFFSLGIEEGIKGENSASEKYLNKVTKKVFKPVYSPVFDGERLTDYQHWNPPGEQT